MPKAKPDHSLLGSRVGTYDGSGPARANLVEERTVTAAATIAQMGRTSEQGIGAFS